MDNTFVLQGKHGIMDYQQQQQHIGEVDQEEDIGSFSSFSNDEEDEGSVDSLGSSLSMDLMEDATSSSSSSSSSLDSSNGPLFEMSSLISHLPIKRGLSKHFEGKSQSFTSLANVKSLEDLMKPERPLMKKMRQLKSSKSYGWGLDKSHSKAITKKSSKGSLSSSHFSNSSIKRHGSFLGSRTQRSGSISSQTLLETIG